MKKRHPDFDQEVERLIFTKKYMDIVIKATELDEESFKSSFKEALDGTDFSDSSLSYLNMLTNANMLQRTTEEIRSLKKIYHKPYFARIDYKRVGKEEEEVLYFGKASLFDRETQDPIIVDWRSPIANLYYDGRIGEVEYEAEGETYDGYLSLKRQYIMEDGELQDIRDVDLTTTDELLQESLSGSSSNRLTDIVSTIQEEQNRIIRADLNKPIIVQGAAGSGKTTIALHRISYFIYTYQDQFRPEQLMILAPNNLFIDYISEVLPELGVDRILQTTFIDFVLSCIGKKVKLRPPSEKLMGFINHEYEDPEMVQWLASFKGSLEFKDIMDRYLSDILETLIPTEDFYLTSKFKLYTAEKMENLIRNEYTYLPYYRRVEKVKSVLQNYVRTEKKVLLHKVERFYDNKLDKALFNMNLDPAKRKSYVTKAMDKKDAMTEEIKRESRTAVNAFIRKLPKHTLFHYFKELVTDRTTFAKYASDYLDDYQIKYFVDYQVKLHRQKEYELEDLAGLLYLQHHLYGIDKDLRARNVVIDEAQDYSYFQLAALKSSLETDMFTIVGDLAQGIHSYRGIQDWNKVKEAIFPRAAYTTLQKSYRTTVEIMETANDILKLLPFELPKVEPVVRHGAKAVFHKWSTSGDSAAEKAEVLEAEIKKLYAVDGRKTIAVIGKTEKECKKIEGMLRKYTDLQVQLLRENEEINQEDVVIVHAQLAKGLEFDAVLLCTLDEVFTETEIDVKLLYVAMTRPLHHLSFYGNEVGDFLLGHVSDGKFLLEE
ncbi:UvrD-helicase domain-containing protein [Bacillus sp. RO2]|uniref:RNA polymerase recycling motor HelD n=1 Tax=Bacillus sp. RO2 TaxID=2723913 RepID=UPI00145C9C15|nr:RNA polymerase recycling motor HelD [Bacillus sp. RO2]NMH73413.1 UvrD-helicase domain-containing protein [Bacillus sp. RO2]